MYGGEDKASAKPITLTTLREMKASGDRIACLTAYDATFARTMDSAGIDLVLVGDSLGMVIQGHPTTVPVSTDDVVYHLRAVSRGLRRAFLVADMPFASYADPVTARVNAVRMMQEGGASMVKLEGGTVQSEVVAHLTQQGIPVCAHVGLKPQSVHKLGGFRVQGRDSAAADAMVRDAEQLATAGADIVLVECVPNDLGRRVAEAVDVPVIGIGAGPDVDGQILVMHDMLGLGHGHRPRFVRDFLAGEDSIAGAFEAYVTAVKDGSYPAPEQTFG